MLSRLISGRNEFEKVTYFHSFSRPQLEPFSEKGRFEKRNSMSTHMQSFTEQDEEQVKKKFTKAKNITGDKRTNWPEKH